MAAASGLGPDGRNPLEVQVLSRSLESDFMFSSYLYKHVVWFAKGSLIEDEVLDEGWYFWDESGMLGGGPYPTEVDAADQLKLYCYQVLGHAHV